MKIDMNALRRFAAVNSGTLKTDGDGNVTKATLRERFRMYFNIGGARDEANRNLLDGLKNAIRSDAGFFGYDDLVMEQIDALRGSHAISGKEIRALFGRIDTLKAGHTQLNDLVTEHAALRGLPPAFERLGASDQFLRVAQNHVYNAFKKSVDDGTRDQFNVLEPLEKFYADCEEMFREAANGEPDLTDLLARSFPSFLIRGDAGLNGVEKVKAKLDGNRAFLRQAAELAREKNSPALERLAYAFVKLHNGVKAEDFTAFRNLALGATRLGSEMKGRFEAVIRSNSLHALDELITDLVRGCEALPGILNEVFLASADDKQCAMRIATRLVVATLPLETQRDLRVFLSSDAAVNLRGFYDESTFLTGGPDATLLSEKPFVLLGILDEVNGLGTESSRPNAVTPDHAKLPSSITCRYSGRHVITSKQGAVPAMSRRDSDTFDLFPKKVNGFAKGLVNMHLAAALAHGAETEEAFGREVAAGLQVKLPDGTMLPNDPSEASKKLAALVTGRKDATPANLDPAERRRVHLAMALLTAQLRTLAQDAVTTGLDPAGRKSVLTPGAGTDKCTLELKLDGEGGVSVHLESRRDISEYTVDGKLSWFSHEETFEVRDGSFADASMDVTISGEEMNRISAQDWTMCDFTDADAYKNAPEKEKRWMQKLPEKLPEEYRIDVDARPTFRLYVGWQAYQEGAEYPANYVRQD